MKLSEGRTKQRPIGFKEPLTNLESQCIKGLQEHPRGYLRKYANGIERDKYMYRFQDERVNPVANISKSVIERLVEKGYLELLTDHKFRLL